MSDESTAYQNIDDIINETQTNLNLYISKKNTDIPLQSQIKALLESTEKKIEEIENSIKTSETQQIDSLKTTLTDEIAKSATKFVSITDKLEKLNNEILRIETDTEQKRKKGETALQGKFDDIKKTLTDSETKLKTELSETQKKIDNISSGNVQTSIDGMKKTLEFLKNKKTQISVKMPVAKQIQEELQKVRKSVDNIQKNLKTTPTSNQKNQTVLTKLLKSLIDDNRKLQTLKTPAPLAKDQTLNVSLPKDNNGDKDQKPNGSNNSWLKYALGAGAIVGGSAFAAYNSAKSSTSQTKSQVPNNPGISILPSPFESAPQPSLETEHELEGGRHNSDNESDDEF